MNLIDVAIGTAALVVASALSSLTGGFSFFTPWIFWGSILLFAAGQSRPPSPHDPVWKRALSIDLCWFVALTAMLRGDWWGVAAVTIGIFVATTSGILVRRAVASRT